MTLSDPTAGWPECNFWPPAGPRIDDSGGVAQSFSDGHGRGHGSCKHLNNHRANRGLWVLHWDRGRRGVVAVAVGSMRCSRYEALAGGGGRELLNSEAVAEAIRPFNSPASSAHGTCTRSRRMQTIESDTGYDTRRRSPDGALALLSQTAVCDTGCKGIEIVGSQRKGNEMLDAGRHRPVAVSPPALAALFGLC